MRGDNKVGARIGVGRAGGLRGRRVWSWSGVNEG